MQTQQKIGREVAFLHVDGESPRGGEGSFIRLTNGVIRFYYTRFTGSSWADDAPADVAFIESADEGETWSAPRIAIPHSEGDCNLMCPTAFRLPDGGLGMTYCVKHGTGSAPDDVLFIRSDDEGESWSAPVVASAQDGSYVVIENDHTIVTKAGRILIPCNLHTLPDENGVQEVISNARMFFLASDDCGKTFYRLSDFIEPPFPPACSGTGLQETTVTEKEDSTLLAWSRTDLFCQYKSVSTDGGRSWTVPYPDSFFSAPASPLLVKKVDGFTVAVFNPIPNYTTRISAPRTWGRTPFVLAVSTDDATSFRKVFFLEDDPENAYCYPAVFDGGDYLLVAYYHSDGLDAALRSTKIVKIEKAVLLA